MPSRIGTQCLCNSYAGQPAAKHTVQCTIPAGLTHRDSVVAVSASLQQNILYNPGRIDTRCLRSSCAGQLAAKHTVQYNPGRIGTRCLRSSCERQPAAKHTVYIMSGRIATRCLHSSCAGQPAAKHTVQLPGRTGMRRYLIKNMFTCFS